MKDKTKKRKWNWAQILAIFVLVTLVVSMVYATVNLITAPSGNVPEGQQTKGDYSLMLMQCVLGVVVLFLPSIISKNEIRHSECDVYCFYRFLILCHLSWRSS